MKMHFALYRKEIRHLSGLLLVISVAYTALYELRMIMGLIRRYYMPPGSMMNESIMTLFKFDRIMLYILPAILVFSFASETVAGKRHLLCALPVRRSSIVLYKFLAVISLGIIIYFLKQGKNKKNLFVKIPKFFKGKKKSLYENCYFTPS